MPTSPEPPRRLYRWELLALLFVTFFFHQGDRGIFGVVLPAIKADLHLTDSQLGLVGSVLFATLAVLMPLTGYLGDVLSRKWIITGSLMFWSFATMITGKAQGVVDLILFRSIATAGGEAFYAPAAYSLIAQFHHKTRALALSIHQCAVYLGVIASGFIGGYVAQRWGWRSAFYIFGIGGIFLAVVLCLRLRNTPQESDGKEEKKRGVKIGALEALSVLFRTPSAMLLTVGFTAIVFVNNAYLIWAPTLVGEKFGLSLTEAGGGSMLYHHLAAMIGVLIGGRLSDAMVLSRRQFRLELQVVAMTLGIPMILLMGLAQSALLTWIAMAGVGLCRGLYESNTHASLFDVIAPRYRASAVAMMTMVAFLAGSTSPWLLGCASNVFADGHGLSYGFAALSLAYLLGVIAIFTALKFTFQHDYKSEEPAEPEA
jgi:MFS transporter, Spinster family, sphingosine-1-phosphate transporter